MLNIMTAYSYGFLTRKLMFENDWYFSRVKIQPSWKVKNDFIKNFYQIKVAQRLVVRAFVAMIRICYKSMNFQIRITKLTTLPTLQVGGVVNFSLLFKVGKFSCICG
jgi:hypothetical protein